MKWFLPGICVLAWCSACISESDRWPVYREGIRGHATVVPGDSYEGTEWIYLDRIAPNATEDLCLYEYRVWSVDGVLDSDCLDCDFEFGIEVGEREQVADECDEVGIGSAINLEGRLGLGFIRGDGGTLMLYWAEDGAYLDGWESEPSADVMFEGLDFSYDHLYEHSFDTIPE